MGKTILVALCVVQPYAKHITHETSFPGKKGNLAKPLENKRDFKAKKHCSGNGSCSDSLKFVFNMREAI